MVLPIHPNNTAYEGVESLERFSGAQFRDYCVAKLKSCDKHVDFIKKNCMGSKDQIRVLEIGSGSGKLLYRLENEGLLSYGTGYELSQSRVTFSHKFSQEFNFKRVQTFCNDVLNADLECESFDLIIGIDVVFNLIGGTSQEFENTLIEKMSRALAPGGFLVFEVMTCETQLKNVTRSESGRFQSWKHFDQFDPIQLGLEEYSIDQLSNLVWYKLFVDRAGQLTDFTNILRPYSPDHLVKLFSNYGFETVIFSSWQDGDDTAEGEFIILGRKV